MKRNHLFDNIKGAMLFLVAFGHILDVYCGEDYNIFEYDLMKFIYLFHMPMFSFVTGYFSKNVEKASNSAVQKILIPFFFFQSIYVLVAAIMIKLGLATFNADVFNCSIILPSSAFYYLLASFIWKVMAKDIMKLRFPIITSVILGVLISLTENSGFHNGYGAAFSLLLFFVLGLKCTEDTIETLRKIPKFVSVLILFLGILAAVYFPYAIHSIRLNYKDEGFSPVTGILWRTVFYIIATLMCIAIICIVTDKETFLCKIGEHSLLVYAGSTFLSPSLYVLFDKIVNVSSYRWVNFICMILFSFFVVMFMSGNWITKLYNIIVSKINQFLFKMVD